MEKKTIKKEAPKKADKPLAEKAEEKTPKKAAGKKGKPVVAEPEKKASVSPAVEPAGKATSVELAAPPALPEPDVKPSVEETPSPRKARVEKSVPAPPLRLRWVRSAIGSPKKHKRIVQGLGFHHLREIITRPDTPMIRGMVGRIPHLVEIMD
ncbi:MAG: 50S ribosomal protein L30 [Acidobacteriia bacterium]|nr:50S ribosomal protein L30 [Terriglobia bacterium]